MWNQKETTAYLSCTEELLQELVDAKIKNFVSLKKMMYLKWCNQLANKQLAVSGSSQRSIKMGRKLSKQGFKRVLGGFISVLNRFP